MRLPNLFVKPKPFRGSVWFGRSPMRSIFLAAATTILLTVGCASHEIHEVEIAAPDGFSGPEHRALGPGTETFAYRKDRPLGQVGTLLQVTRHEFGDALKNLPESERYPTARKYLLDFLKGIERRRTNYNQSAPTAVSLDSRSAARAEWTGQYDGIDAHGVMYAVIAGTTLYVFHTQDPLTAPAADMQDAIHAIESVKFKRIER
jgi:hypothetical protein